MCRILVTFRSRTGASGYYAAFIASRLGADRKEWSSGMDLSGYDLVIYGAGVYSGEINGLREVRAEIRKQQVPYFVIYATGGTPNSVEKTISLMWDLNLRGDDYSFPHFYMQAGICYARLPLKDRLRLKIVAAMMRSQKYDECGMPLKMGSSYSIADPQYADSLVDYVRAHYA